MNPISRPNSPSTAGSSASPSSIHTPQSVSSLSSSDSDTTIILSHSDSELRTCAWPRDFTIPHFPYDVEVQLQRENEIFRETGTSLKIPPGLKPDILDKLAEEIFQYTAYLQNHQIDVAGALTQKFPCLRDLSATGYYSWMISLKYKVANYWTKMWNIGCPEVTVNALKNKSRDECFHSAKNVKKAKKAEVNYCPSHPTGETDDSLENLRVELLTDVRQRSRASHVREKMSKTFSYQRKEVVHGSPGAGEMKVRWPALFHINEVNTCLLPSSVPLFIVHFHYVL